MLLEPSTMYLLKGITFQKPIPYGLLSLRSSEKTPTASDAFLGWVSNFRRISDEYILNHHSLDAYLYVRFFKMMVFMSFVGCILTWPVLIPVNATGGGGESGLDILSFSNVNNPTRYFAHALIGWVFFGTFAPQ
jgi:hypothetical protein